MIAQPTLLLGFFMLAMLIALTHFVSIGNVIHNMLSVHATNLSTYIVHAILNTEAWTLVIIGVLIFSAFSLRFTLAPMKRNFGYSQA